MTMNKSKIKRFLTLSLAVLAFVLVGGHLAESRAQERDPFKKVERNKPKPPTTGTTTTGANTTGTTPQKPVKPQIVVVAAPPIEARIAYYKRIREEAVRNGLEIPKVTSVLTLDEMAVTGIFRTPRGYAAMIEAKQIGLSYTIYPGEKFFDGQLVAIEENQVIFRKITKMSNNKFVTSVENKTLRQYSDREVVQNTAPVTAQTQTQTTTQQTETVTNNQQTTNPAQTTTTTTQSDIVISPLDEMNRQQQTEQTTPATKKPTKKVSKKGK